MVDVNSLLSYELAEKQKDENVIVAGTDEVGRGPLAGPVVCASVIMPLDDLIEGVNDSKKLSQKKREELAKIIKEKAIAYSICEEDEKTIDEINILNATKKCMTNAVQSLSVKPNVLLIDAITLPNLDSAIKQVPIIHGDATSYNIACASIIAKVYRDDLMTALDSKYPEYNFKKHKGYGTAEHIRAIREHGLCEIHRRSFTSNFVGDKK